MSDGKIGQARHVLRLFGMDEERSNERSALTLLALLHLRSEDEWSEASNLIQLLAAAVNLARFAKLRLAHAGGGWTLKPA